MSTTDKSLTAITNFRDFLFADLALRRNLLDADVLSRGQTVLNEMSQFGIRSSLISVLVDRRLVDREAVKEIVSEFSKVQVPCPSCRRPLSLQDLNSEGRIRCPSCDDIVGFEFRQGVAPIPGALEGSLVDNVQSVSVNRGDKKVSSRLSVPAATSHPTPPERHKRPDTTRKTPARRPRPQEKPSKRMSKAIPECFLQSPVPKYDTKNLTTAYNLQSVIHCGPFGRLYLAQPKTRQLKDTEIALKVLSSSLNLGRDVSERLNDEVSFWNTLYSDVFRSPYVFGIGNDPAFSCRPYLGKPFEEVTKFRSDSVEEKGQLLHAITRSLAEVHESGRVHGNLKPSNIFYEWKDDAIRVVLVDSAFHFLVPKNNALAHWHFLTGNARYCPPEEIDNRELNAASDIYALGWVFFTVLSDTPPFSTQPPPKILLSHQFGPCPELSDEFGHWNVLVKAMTAVKPEERPPDAHRLLPSVDAVLRGKRPKLKRVTPRAPLAPVEEREIEKTKAPRKQKRFRWRCLLGPLLLIATVSWVSFCAWRWHNVYILFSSESADRNVVLYDQVAEEAFKRASVDAKTYPQEAQGIWEEYLRVFGSTSFEGAARAELRNLKKSKAVDGF